MNTYPELDDLLGRSVTRLLADSEEAQERIDILRATQVRGGMHALLLGHEYRAVIAYHERIDRALSIACADLLR